MNEAAQTSSRATTVKPLGDFMTVAMLLSPSLDPDQTRDAPSEVWHYTNAGGAAGIIGKRELWATDGLFMNDSSELQVVHRDFTRALKSRASEHFISDSERKLLLSAFERALSSFREDPGIFVVCFCESGDLLSQWQSYGRAGGGYALGFESAALAGYDKAVIGNLDFFKVVYDRADQIEAVAEFCVRAFYQLELFLAGSDEEEREPALEKTGRVLALMAQWYSARVKDAAFREEQEWRFICRNPTAPGRPATYARQFRVTDRGLIPFVPLQLGQIGRDTAPDAGFPLKRVIVGPTASAELAARAMNYLLKDNGFEVQAEVSSIPLRR